MAFVFLLLAEGIIRLLGIEDTSYLARLVFAAAVLAGGAFALIRFCVLGVHLMQRLLNRQPAVENEDY